MNYSCYQIRVRVKIFTHIESSAKSWLDIYQWVAGLAVTGRKRDVGQNDFQSSLKTGSSSSPSYCHIFLLSAFIEKVFIINIIILRNNYILIMWINNNNNSVINYNLWESRRPYFVLKNSHGHAKGCHPNLWTIRTRALKTFIALS
jgi:hypothetical protein